MKKNKLVLSIWGVATATILSRVLGMAKELIIADIYGADAISDALIMAINIPLALLAFIGSAVGDTYIPFWAKTEPAERGRISNNLLWILIMVGLFTAISFSIYPQAIVKLFAAGFTNERLTLTCQLIQYVIWTIIPILLVKLLGAYLQIKNIFWIINLSGVLINIITIGVIYVSAGNALSLPFIGVGICIGYYLQLVILIIAAYKKGWNFRFPQKKTTWGISAYFRVAVPILFSVGISELNGIIDKNFASLLPVGMISNMNYAMKTAGVIYSAIMAVTTVLFPKLTGLNDETKRTQLIEMLRKAISGICFIVIPTAIGCYILAPPIIQVLFMHGNFAAEDTVVTATALRIYAIEILPICLSPLIIRVFYALNDMKTPLRCSCISVSINLLLNSILIWKLQYKGLIVATVVSDGILAILLFVQLYRKYRMALFQYSSKWICFFICVVITGIYISWIYYKSAIYMVNFKATIITLSGIIISSIMLYIGISVLGGIIDIKKSK